MLLPLICGESGDLLRACLWLFFWRVKLNELIVVGMKINGVEIQTTDARKLHEWLLVGRDFSNWIKGRIEEYGFEDGVDYIMIDSPNRANQKKGGDRRSRDYHLTLDMAKELSMVENNAKGRQARKYFIECERKLKELQKSFIESRVKQESAKVEERAKLRVEYLPMQSALQDNRLEQGKETKSFHYSNEADLINRIVLGCTSKAFRANHSIEQNDPIRDHLSALEQKALLELQRANTVYINDGISFEERKVKLNALFIRKHLKNLTEEVHRLNA